MLGRWYAFSQLFSLLGLQPDTIPLSPRWLKATHAWFLPQLIARVHHWQIKLAITRPYRIRLRSMRSRLGSNSRKTMTLTFASKLMHVAWPMIDAVIVHELIHDRHFDHSPNFYQALKEAYPDYEQEHAKLLLGHYQ
jgi:predicted metal-dependent hydrolase